MSNHYFITADHGHLRIYLMRQNPGQRAPSLQQVAALDFPAGVHGYAARETSMTGRFQGAKHQAAGPGAPGPGVGRTGMSMDERLPMQREEEKRRIRDVASQIQTFLAAQADATWDFAGALEIQRTVIEQLSSRVRQRLRRSTAKNLVNQRAENVRAHFIELAAT